MINKQLIVPSSNLFLVAMLAYAGYPYRYMPQESNYWFEDSGDIDSMVADFESGQQPISDCKALLATYEELRGQQSTVILTSGPATELVPTQHPYSEVHTWTTRDTTTAILLRYANYRLIRTEVENGSVEFIFAWDDKLTEVVKRFNKNEWLVSPKKWSESAFVIRSIVRSAKEYGQPRAPMSSGLSNYEETQ